MATPNYLGTLSNLTGIPSLLLSGLQQVQDPVVKTALYQIQNWANSFYTWNFNVATGTYATGGITVDFNVPFASNVAGLTFGPFEPVIDVSLTNIALADFSVKLYGSGGTEIANGTSFEFYYIGVGH